MKVLVYIFSLVWLLQSVGCTKSDRQASASQIMDKKIDSNSMVPENRLCKALLASRYSTLENLKAIAKIEYSSASHQLKDQKDGASWVKVTYVDRGRKIESVLESGLSQDDLAEARDGSYWDKLNLLSSSPSTVANRYDLNKVYSLARWKPSVFGEGDVAFYNLAKESVANICTPELAFFNEQDSSDKGYINTFNHVTAQAFITTCFSEEIADFVADVHELHNMAELTTGNFTKEMLSNISNNAVDNYVDMINNECGQELGKLLCKKYGISPSTKWDTQLLTDYLNDLQRYYGWTFSIGFKPFNKDEEVIMRFVNKLNVVMQGMPIVLAR